MTATDNPLFLIDFYKVGHVSQYPADTTQVWSNWTPRSSRVPGQKVVRHVGLRYFMQRYLSGAFEDGFFRRPWPEVEAEYKEVIRATLGVADPKTDHIERLHRHGRLPIRIYSLPEGTGVPIGCPAMVITNTEPWAYWLPNYLETILSNVLWMPSTSATTARRFRDVFVRWAKAAGETDPGFVDWQGHDFSFRGMAGTEAAVLSGLGHLTCFSGTDTVPAILAAQKYYGAALSVGGSVPATEHSVMCAAGQDGEFETFNRLVTEVYPSGIVSIVSDTWDLWKVLTDYVPRLREEILTRDGKIVIRPDSGDPETILCGWQGPVRSLTTPEQLGALRLLARALGTDGAAHGHINKGGLIYGDSITVERADSILARTVNELGLSPYNMVFGIGSYAYQYVTRDTHNFAMKATAVRRAGEVVPIFKDPVTDNAHKKSHRGIPVVYDNADGDGDTRGGLFYIQTDDPRLLDNCAYVLAYDGDREGITEAGAPSFDDVRRRVRA